MSLSEFHPTKTRSPGSQEVQAMDPSEYVPGSHFMQPRDEPGINVNSPRSWPHGGGGESLLPSQSLPSSAHQPISQSSHPVTAATNFFVFPAGQFVHRLGNGVSRGANLPEGQ
eukprot:766865-Hanusia_phi.AAC.12